MPEKTYFCLAKKEKGKITSILCYYETFKEVEQQYVNLLKQGVFTYNAYRGYNKKLTLEQQKLEKVRFRSNETLAAIKAAKSHIPIDNLPLHSPIREKQRSVEVSPPILIPEKPKPTITIKSEKVNTIKEYRTTKTATVDEEKQKTEAYLRYVKKDVKPVSVYFYTFNFLQKGMNPTFNKTPWSLDWQKNYYTVRSRGYYKDTDVSISLYAKNDEEARNRAIEIYNKEVLNKK